MRRKQLTRVAGVAFPQKYLHLYSVCWLEPSKYVQNNSITKHHFCCQICHANNAQGHLSPHTLATQTIPGVLRCHLIRASKDLLGFKPEKRGPSVRSLPNANLDCLPHTIQLRGRKQHDNMRKPLLLNIVYTCTLQQSNVVCIYIASNLINIPCRCHIKFIHQVNIKVLSYIEKSIEIKLMSHHLMLGVRLAEIS